LDEVARLASKRQFFDDELPGLQMQNGFLTIDMATGAIRLLENSPEIRSRWVVPADYLADATCDVFQAGLTRAIPDQQSRKSLLEKLGAAVMGLQLPGDNANSITLLVGPPRSGKSTIVKVLEMLVPEEMRATLQPAAMSEKFMATALEGKRINLVPELDVSRTLGGPVLKAVTSRETITVRGIRENPRSMTPRAAQVLVSNEMPRIDDKTGAYLRRLSFYSFSRALSREEVDPDYLAKLEAELAGIVALLVRNLADAVARGFFQQPTEQDEMMSEMRRERDIVTQAISERVERRSGSRLSNRELFDCVRAHAASKGIDLGHLEGVALGRRVAKAMREQHRTEQVKSHGVPTYEGVRLKIQAADPVEGLGQMDI
jgi:putative DNA primase/helicase